MKVVLKVLLVLMSLGLGFFILLIGMVGEGAAPNPFWWYVLLAFFFGAPLVWLFISGYKQHRK
jgi:hypothetical protein